MEKYVKFLLLFTGRHFWNRKCRKKTWWQQEFAVFKCEATANSVTGHDARTVINFSKEWREGGIGACQLAGDSCILGEDVIIWSRKREDTNMIKAVIFDMDGVIIDSEGIYLNYLYEYAKTKNPEVTLESLHGTVGTTKQDCWMVVEKAIHNGQTWQELHDEYLGRWTDIFNSIDYLSIFRPEILDVMDRLKAEGFRLAVASATNIEQVERILKENGVASRLERMISASTFKRSKPDPAVYLYTAEQMGLQPEECLVIEDSTVGITAGHCAGMTVAALIDNRFSFDRSLADYELNSLEEIVPLAEKIRDLK